MTEGTVISSFEKERDKDESENSQIYLSFFFSSLRVEVFRMSKRVIQGLLYAKFLRLR